MDIRRFHKQLFDAVRDLIPPGQTVVCAVSGGADSMAMLHGLVKVNEIRECRWRICVAHLDHGLPYDSKAVEKFVQQSAAGLKLLYYANKANVPKLSKSTGLSIEECGRKVRYEFLARAAAHFDATIVCIAHHMDDQAETVLHRIIRGTGLIGLAGIRRERLLDKSIRIIRPMLDLSRDEIRAYLDRRSLEFMDDPTNRDLKAALRNRIRHELLPVLGEHYNPRVVHALVRLARQAESAAEALRDLANQELEQAIQTSSDDSLTLNVVSLAELPRGLQAEIVRCAITRLDCDLKAIATHRIDAAVDLFRETSRMRLIQMSGLIVERRGRTVRFKKQDRKIRKKSRFRELKETQA